LSELKEIGINRLSFGCQTFDDKILNLIGRRHNSNDVKKAVKFAQNAGFENISLDFIYGLPTQTVSGFEEDLKIAKSLDIQHISLYGLKIDENCYFYKNPPKDLPDEDIQADMYLKAIEILDNFEHYEISNFSKKGFNSRHNLNYWNNKEYYGFGVAAHGYQGNVRYFNSSNLDEYIKNPTKHKDEHRLNKQEQLEEEIFLGFRKTSGINIKTINQKFDINFKEKYKKTLEKYDLFLIETNEGFKLNTNGILVSNVILAEFLE
jgi:oxygen-independent coproporphyrinogen-3 oxidase